MRLTAKFLVSAAILFGLATEASAGDGEQKPSASSSAANAASARRRAANSATRRQIRRYSFRGGVPFSPRGWGVYPNREATAKARGDYAPFHGGNYIP